MKISEIEGIVESVFANRVKSLDIATKNLNTFVSRLAASLMPSALEEVFKTHPEFFYDGRCFFVYTLKESPGGPLIMDLKHPFFMDLPLPIPYAERYEYPRVKVPEFGFNQIKSRLESLEKERRELDSLCTSLEDALRKLRTMSRILKEFPELEQHMPKPETSPDPEFKELRARLRLRL